MQKNSSLKLNRILLKLSGELLRNDGDSSNINATALDRVSQMIREISIQNVEIALVIGAGNLFRGAPASGGGMGRSSADYIGMLATVMNALAIRDALERHGVPACIQSAIPMSGIVGPFDQREAVRSLQAKEVVIFAGGTGHPYFTTDTTGALRACEIHADAILKATKVDGVYSADPQENLDAIRYAEISYQDALRQQLKVMDATAFSLCMENNIPIIVFNCFRPNALKKIISGDFTAATIVSQG